MSRKRRGRKLQGATGSMVRTPAPPWVHWVIALVITLATVAVFLPTLQNGFVNWDDDENLLSNPHYRGLGWAQLRWMWTTLHMGHWIPLTWMSFGLDYVLWGMNPVGYHLTSLLLHVANALVFYLVAFRILRLALPGPTEPGKGIFVGAGFAALLFAIHPLRVESVAWATERRDVLSGLFYLLAVLAYLRAWGGRGRRWYCGSVALFAGALLSKSMAVTLPVVLLILDVYPLRRLGGTVGWWGVQARRVYLEKLPFALLAAAASAIAFIALFTLNNTAPLDQLGVGGRLAVSAYGLAFYLWKTIAPFNLSPLYPLPVRLNPSETAVVLSAGAVLGITALALAFRRRWPGLLAVWAAYGALLLPVLGFFQNGPQIAADRYTYLANLGWALLAGASLATFSRARPRLSGVLAGCILVGLGVVTWSQVGVWRDPVKLWTHAISIDARSAIPHYNLGNAFAEQGRMPEAIEHFRRAARIVPSSSTSDHGIALAPS